jgi:mono/diheme cytochrome c family protein
MEGAAPAAVAVSVPEGNLRGDAAKGAQLYGLYCTACHGPTGAGDGPLAATLIPRPANHTDAVYLGSLSDEHLYRVIQGGGAAVGKSPLMAPWGAVVSEEQTRDLIAHLRALSGT